MATPVFFRSGGEFVYLCVLWQRCPIDCSSVWGIPLNGSFPPCSSPAHLPFLSAAVSLRPPPPPPSSNPWKFGTNELTAELPPRSLVPNYTVLHTRFILQMARLRSPAGRGHLFHWSVKVDGCCFRILCDQLRAPSNHPAPYVENKSPC